MFSLNFGQNHLWKHKFLVAFNLKKIQNYFIYLREYIPSRSTFLISAYLCHNSKQRLKSTPRYFAFLFSNMKISFRYKYLNRRITTLCFVENILLIFCLYVIKNVIHIFLKINNYVINLSVKIYSQMTWEKNQ